MELFNFICTSFQNCYRWELSSCHCAGILYDAFLLRDQSAARKSDGQVTLAAQAIEHLLFSTHATVSRTAATSHAAAAEESSLCVKKLTCRLNDPNYPDNLQLQILALFEKLRLTTPKAHVSDFLLLACQASIRLLDCQSLCRACLCITAILLHDLLAWKQC